MSAGLTLLLLTAEVCVCGGCRGLPLGGLPPGGPLPGGTPPPVGLPPGPPPPVGALPAGLVGSSPPES